jgi:hypothetical protein
LANVKVLVCADIGARRVQNDASRAEGIREMNVAENTSRFGNLLARRSPKIVGVWCAVQVAKTGVWQFSDEVNCFVPSLDEIAGVRFNKDLDAMLLE